MTSAPGQRKSEHLIEQEAYRRIMSGEAPETLDEFARQLSNWLVDAYPGASPPVLHVVEDRIREMWHRRHELIRGG
jgi:hypothetical protein